MRIKRNNFIDEYDFIKSFGLLGTKLIQKQKVTIGESTLTIKSAYRFDNKRAWAILDNNPYNIALFDLVDIYILEEDRDRYQVCVTKHYKDKAKGTDKLALNIVVPSGGQ